MIIARGDQRSTAEQLIYRLSLRYVCSFNRRPNSDPLVVAYVAAEEYHVSRDVSTLVLGAEVECYVFNALVLVELLNNKMLSEIAMHCASYL